MSLEMNKEYEIFKNKNVMITGATGAIGFQLTKRFLEYGANVVGLIHDESKINQFFEQYVQIGQLKYIEVELKYGAKINESFKQAMLFLKGRLDILVCCHGKYFEGNVTDTDVEQFDQNININVKANLHLLSLSVPFLKVTKGNAIMISSITSKIIERGDFLQALNKSMINSLIENAALELASFGVRVNGVSLGTVNSDFRKSSFRENNDKYFTGFHCILMDLPKHGDSKSEEIFSIDKSAEDILNFMEDLIELKNIKKINIVALGLGGQIAIELINKNPQIIDKLILSGLEIADFKVNKEESIINRLAKTQSEYLNEKPDTFITKAYLRYFGIKKEHYTDVERILERPIKDEKTIAYESLNYTIPNDLKNNKEILEKEDILIIFGSKEDLNCTKSAIELKNLFKNAKLIEIIKGNHLWNIIDYELFNTIIIDFIKSRHIEENSKVKILE